MEEVSIKTHLIVTDIHEEYHIDWCGKIMDANPKFKNNKPIFIKEKDGNEKLLGILTHNHIKQYAPMYDKVGYR